MKKISCIIRDLNPKPETIKSIPKDNTIETIVSTWKAPDYNYATAASAIVESMAVARNDGARKAKGEIYVLLDGDLKFTESFFWKTINECGPRIIVGLQNPYHKFLQGSYIVIRNKDFHRAGGVDPHFFYHEDIAFSYKLESMGYKVIYHKAQNVKNLDTSPTRYCMRFPQQFRIQLAMGILYPKLHLKKIPRTLFYDYLYHKYSQSPKEKKQWLATLPKCDICQQPIIKDWKHHVSCMLYKTKRLSKADWKKELKEEIKDMGYEWIKIK